MLFNATQGGVLVQGAVLIRRYLGEAYARDGRHADVAGRLLRASLDEYLANGDDAQQPMMAIRESWGGGCSTTPGQPRRARSSMPSSPRLASGHWRMRRWRRRAWRAVALALGRHAARAAGERGGTGRWQRTEGFRDVRMGPYMQRIRADALAAAGQREAAQALEDAAAAASAGYDDPSSATTRRRSFPDPQGPVEVKRPGVARPVAMSGSVP